MRVMKKMNVHHILTETLKEELQEKYGQQKARLLEEAEQLRFQKQKQNKERETENGRWSAMDKFNKEIEKRKEELQQLYFLQNQLEHLPIGSELSYGTTEVMFDIEVGSPWHEGEHWGTIVVEEGIVKEIRSKHKASDEDGMV